MTEKYIRRIRAFKEMIEDRQEQMRKDVEQYGNDIFEESEFISFLEEQVIKNKIMLEKVL